MPSTQFTLWALLALQLPFASLIPAAPTVSPPSTNPLDDARDPRIIGGVPVGSNDKYPFMVSLQKVVDNKRTQWCGGSLIAPDLVLTAAHCTGGKFEGWVVSGYRYNLTKSSEEEGGIDWDVVGWKIHPEYRTVDRSPYNDVAIWKLRLKSNFANRTILPAAYATDPNALTADGAITPVSIGWGATRVGGPTSNLLMEVALPVINQAACRKLYGYWPDEYDDKCPIYPGSICAGFEEGGKDTCQGDSGGPLFGMNADGQFTVYGT
ncbi:hypothetical protein HK102_003284, partial [Quaeritorhiza haematococci]